VLSSLDLILVVASVIIMVTGFARRYRMWTQGRPEALRSVKPLKGGCQILLSLFRNRKFSYNPYGNIAHIFVFWGFIIPFLVFVISQFRPVAPTWAGQGLSLLLDVLGLLAIIGTCMLISKRLFKENKYSARHPVHLWVLLAVLITGFFAEGLRLTITRDAIGELSALYSPVGYIFSRVVPASPALLKIVVRMHFFLVLIFIAYIPYSNMRHAWASLFSAYYHNTRPEGTLMPIALEGNHFGTGSIKDFPWMQLMDSDACMNCGRCDANCPAHISGKPLMPQGVIRSIGLQMEKTFHNKGTFGDHNTLMFSGDGLIGREDIWACTTCLACVKSCPVFVRHLTDIAGLRRYSVLTESRFPPEYRQLFKNLETFGDPFGAGSPMRENWASGLYPVRAYQDNKVDFLLWVGCMGALYDGAACARTIEVSDVLKKAGVSFGILGKEEFCCGDAARRLGNEYLFQQLAKRNIDKMSRYGIKKIVTSCPHCFNVFRNEYPLFGGAFEVIHVIELLQDLIKQGRLKVKSKTRSTFTYHDPCYLGRYNNIERQPRDILEMLVEIKEMEFSGDNSFCCGAGGGNFWCGRTTGRRMEEIRIEHAIKTGADGLVTSCPFCEILFDSAVRQKGAEYSFKVMDIIQLVNQLTE
jgi:Fe-S oxidoreductase/nitrate reductase gamma subunit